MGNFYANVTLVGPPHADVIHYLCQNDFRAYVSPCVEGVTSIAEARCDDLDQRHLDRFTATLSDALHCSALWVSNHDDDVLRYALFAAGKLDHRYSSGPYEVPGFLFTKTHPPDPADVVALRDTFGGEVDTADLDRVLAKPSAGTLVAAGETDIDDKAYVFAFERHQDLLSALGIPLHGVCFGYRYATAGELPPDVSAGDLVST